MGVMNVSGLATALRWIEDEWGEHTQVRSVSTGWRSAVVQLSAGDGSYWALRFTQSEWYGTVRVEQADHHGYEPVEEYEWRELPLRRPL